MSRSTPFRAGLAALLLLASHAFAAPDAVTIAQGALHGASNGDVVTFKAIPYAAPPVGPLRWKPPQAPLHWEGVREAVSFGPACMQPARAGWPVIPTSEDCLTLNVWAPASHRASAKLPVMVWIYGGSFVYGSGASPVYDGAGFAKAGVVLVTLNYRLGRFGFFAHPALTAESPKGPLANYGLMDQIAALKWVKGNIAAFGGDPASVTVFGESAGAMSVNDLMVSPLARGLFAKAISESGFGRFTAAPLANAEDAGVRIAKAAGAKDGADAAALRALPAQALVGQPTGVTDTMFLRPVLDGVVLSEQVAQAFAAGHQARVPFLEGGNSWEASLFPPVRKYPDLVIARLGAEPEAIALYGDGDDHARLAADLVTDQLMIEPDRHLARQMVKAKVPVWVYFFSYVPAAQRGDEIGARHGAEVPYVFDNLPPLPIQLGERSIPAATADDEAIAKAMHAYWIAFAKTGDPGAAGGVRWPRFEAAKESVLEFGADGVNVRPKFRTTRLDAAAAMANPLAKP